MSNKRIHDELDYQRITEIEKLEKELDEQLLVNGKGQQRELKLMTERDKLKRQLDELKDHFVSKTEYDDQEAEIAKFKAELKAAREEIQNLKDGEWPIELSEAGGEIDRLNAQLTEARAKIERLKEEIQTCYDVINNDASIDSIIPFKSLKAKCEAMEKALEKISREGSEKYENTAYQVPRDHLAALVHMNRYEAYIALADYRKKKEG